MGNDPLADLSDLVADVRAILEDGAARGVQWEPVRAAGDAVADAPEAQAAAPEAPPRHAAWSDLAASARDGGLPAAARLAQVREDLGDCRRCVLARERRNIVFGVGSPEADLVIVGEAPGFKEDQRGEPFVGPAGQMLDRMLENVIGLGRSAVYILNVVKCRPPKNRNPLPEEIDACRPFLDAQIDALQPKVMLVLGSVAFRTLFRTNAGITRNRGAWKDHRGIPTMPTFHPAYLLRKPQDKRLTFEDLKVVRQQYDALGGRRE